MFDRDCFRMINIETTPTIITTAMIATIAITAAVTLVDAPPPVGFDTASMLPSSLDAATIAVVVVAAAVVVVVVVVDESRT